MIARMSFFGSMMGGMVGRALMPLTAAAGFGAYKTGAVDPATLFGPVAPAAFEMEARVVSVERSCRLRLKQDGRLRQTQAMPCTDAAALARTGDFSGWHVVTSDAVSYIYYAPDGRTTLQGRFNDIGERHGRTYRAGSVIGISVDAKDPTKSKVL